MSGTLEDPFGHRWIIVTRLEDLGPEDVLSRSIDVAPNDRLPVGKPGVRR